MAKSVKGTKTEHALKDAFAGESKANRRYLYFANMADVAGAPDVAAVFRSTAEGETGHAHGHMEYLITGGAGDPETGLPAGSVTEALESAIAGETHEYTAICTPVWQRLLVMKALMRLLIGSKH
jgi:rubrerythrin